MRHVTHPYRDGRSPMYKRYAIYIGDIPHVWMRHVTYVSMRHVIVTLEPRPYLYGYVTCLIDNYGYGYEERWGAGVEYHFQEFTEPYAPS